MDSDVKSVDPLPPETTLGERLRQLRTVRGLTQSDLAGERFSKEYVSQIERGKTRPTERTLDWLAERLDVDRAYLETGLSEADRMRAESAVVRAEAAIASQRYDEAVDLLAKVETPIFARGAAARAARRVVGAHVPRRASRRAGARGGSPGAGRGITLHGPRSGRGSLPARLLPLQAVVGQLGG